ncbi:hypothetical protein PR001_g25353 [Phytophthora rubi]|nr:hypothetical protein PR001_g25353 [Phytophthora rubi]
MNPDAVRALPLGQHAPGSSRKGKTLRTIQRVPCCSTGKCSGDRNCEWPELWSRHMNPHAAFLALVTRLSAEASEDHFHICKTEASMAPRTTQALEIFTERDHIRENVSILTYTQEEEVNDYFDAEWDEEDVIPTSRSRSASVESIWSSCSTPASFSVLGVCTTPTTQAKKVSPRRMSSPISMSPGEAPTERSLPKLPSMPHLFRPSELGIDLSSVIGDPRRAGASR